MRDDIAMIQKQAVSPQKLRLALFCAAVAIAVLCAFASYLSQFRDRNLTVIIMLICAICALIRGVNGQNRRDLIDRYFQYHGTPMYDAKCIRPDMRAAVAWALLDSIWIALDITTCLTLWIPGVFGIIFQCLFLYGFDASRTLRPDLWDSIEKTQSMDMLESLLYAQACAAMIAAAFIMG